MLTILESTLFCQDVFVPIEIAPGEFDCLQSQTYTIMLKRGIS